MKYLFALLISLAAFAEPTATDRYLALTATLLEHRIIADEHLLRMIDGQLNPISEVETKTHDINLEIHNLYTNLLKENIDAARIAIWVTKRLSHEGKIALLQSLAARGRHTCTFKADNTLKCWEGNNG